MPLYNSDVFKQCMTFTTYLVCQKSFSKSDCADVKRFGKINLVCLIRYQMILTSILTLKHTIIHI